MQDFQLTLILVSACLLVHSPVQSEECGQEELIQCSHQIQVLTKTSEFNFVDNREELQRVCPDLHTGLQCIRSYTRRCMSLHQREHFNQLYEGTNQMIHDLCKEGTYQEDFLLHAPCMRKVKKDYDICSRSYQIAMSRITEEQSVTEPAMTSTTTMLPIFQRHQHHRNDSRHNSSLFVSMETTTLGTPRNNTNNQSNEENHIKTVCCAFQKYMECSEIAVARECGPETAEFTRKFLDKMLSSLMRMHCESPEKRKCEEYYSSSPLPFIISRSIILMSLLLVLANLL